MSKNSIRQKKPSRATRNRYRMKVAIIADLLSLLTTAVAGLWQKLRQAARRASGKTKEDAIWLPGPVYVSGSSPIAASEIATIYDRSEYPDIYSSPTDNDMPVKNSLWPTWTDVVDNTHSNNPLIASDIEVDGRTTQGLIDDDWMSYNSDTPDPDSNDE